MSIDIKYTAIRNISMMLTLGELVGPLHQSHITDCFLAILRRNYIAFAFLLHRYRDKLLNIQVEFPASSRPFVSDRLPLPYACAERGNAQLMRMLHRAGGLCGPETSLNFLLLSAAKADTGENV